MQLCLKDNPLPVTIIGSNSILFDRQSSLLNVQETMLSAIESSECQPQKTTAGKVSSA